MPYCRIWFYTTDIVREIMYILFSYPVNPCEKTRVFLLKMVYKRDKILLLLMIQIILCREVIRGI